MAVPPTPVPGPANVTTGGTVPGTVTGTLDLADGGVWTGGTVQLGSVGGFDQGGLGGTAEPGTIVVAASPSATPTTLDAVAILLGASGNLDAASPSTSGTLDVSGGSRIDTSTLSLVDGSHVTIDAGSSVAVGTTAAQAGALSVGDGTTVDVVSGNIFGNVVLDGMIDELPFGFFFEDGGDRFQIDGTLTGTGLLQGGALPAMPGLFNAPGVMLEIGDASLFAGTIALAPTQVLVLDRGGAPHAAIAMNGATVDLLGVPYTAQVPSYDAATGLLAVGTAALDVGLGMQAANFAVRPDGIGSTLLIEERLPTWLAVNGNPNGDWGDAAHWSVGGVPLAGDTVAIGPGISSALPWTVTVADVAAADLTLGAGLGTLAASGGLSLQGTLSIMSGTLLATAGAVVGAQSFIQSGGSLDVSAGQVFTTFATLEGSAATVQDGGSWTASELAVGGTALDPAPETLAVSAGTLAVQDTLAIGASPIGESVLSTGTLALADGAVASAGAVTLSSGSALSLDGTSGLTVGAGGGTAGAGTILVEGTFDVTGTADIAGNLLDQGSVLLGAASVNGAGFLAGATLAGALSGAGVLMVASEAVIGSASGFAGTIEIQGLSTLTVAAGAAPGGMVDFEVAGFPSPAVLDLRGVAPGDTNAVYDPATGLLSFGATTLDVGTDLPTRFTAVADNHGGTDVLASACFAAGTRIATVAGEIAVERLAVGDRVRGPWGEAMPIRWLGHRQVDCARHPNPEKVWPVRVLAGAFGPGRPARDLWLSPDHAVFVAPPGRRPVLIPAGCLIDGASVVQERTARVVYWHVELDRHAVLLAEGLPCESFLDVGNRAAFANGGPPMQLHPDFCAARWHAHACAPQVRGGPVLDWARRLLALHRETEAA